MALERWLALLFVMTLVACGAEERRRDVVQPYLVEVQPQQFELDANEGMALRFSENLFPEAIANKQAMLLPKGRLSDALLIDMLDGKPTQANLKLALPMELKLEAPNLLRMRASALEPGITYVLLLLPNLRDLSGNPVKGVGEKRLPPMIQFRAKSVSVSIATRLSGRVEIRPDQKSVPIELPSALELNTGERVALVGPTGSDEFLKIELSQSGKRLNLIAPEPKEGCERWPLGVVYELVKLPSKEKLAELVAVGVCDTQPLAWRRLPKVSSLKESAQVDFELNKSAKVWLWYGQAGGALNCLGHRCPIEIAANGAVLLKGVSDAGSYRFALRAEDERGQKVHAQGEWSPDTLPQASLSEVMANPMGLKGAAQAEGEYLKVVNFGDSSVDLRGYALSIQNLKTQTTRSCPLGESEALKVAPKSFVLLTGQRFSLGYYPGLSVAYVHRVKSAQLCGLLSNSEAQKILLKDSRQRVVSSYSGHLIASREGVSIQRVQAEGPDVKENFRFKDLTNGWSQ